MYKFFFKEGKRTLEHYQGIKKMLIMMIKAAISVMST